MFTNTQRIRDQSLIGLALITLQYLGLSVLVPLV